MLNLFIKGKQHKINTLHIIASILPINKNIMLFGPFPKKRTIKQSMNIKRMIGNFLKLLTT